MAVRYESYTIADIAQRIGVSEATARKYLRDGDLGDHKPMGKGMYRLPEGTIGAFIIAREAAGKEKLRMRNIQDQKRLNSKALRDKNLKFKPRYRMHEAKEQAEKQMEEFVAKHINAWKRDQTEAEIDFKKQRILRQYLHQLLSETDGVPLEALSESEKRIALQAPVFMMDTLSRLQPDDMSYFLAELKKYYDLGYDIDARPDVCFTINQLIFEQVGLKHTQTLYLLQEYSVDKEVDESMNRAMIRIDKLFKMLRECGEPGPKPENPGGGGESQNDEMY